MNITVKKFHPEYTILGNNFYISLRHSGSDEWLLISSDALINQKEAKLILFCYIFDEVLNDNMHLWSIVIKGFHE